MDPPSLTKQLWERAKAGDQFATEELFAIHTDRLLGFTRARMSAAMREKLEPTDVLQDAYLAASKRFGELDYSTDGAFVRWMCRIIDNRLRDLRDHHDAIKRQAVPLPKSSTTGPATNALRKEQQARVFSALDALSPDHREVILLRYFQGLSTEEACVRMQRTSGALRSLVARALVELGKQLKSPGDSRS